MAANVMRRVSLRNLAAHKVRLLLTVLSVVLGTAFVTGSFVFTDTLQKTFNGIFATADQGVDAQVTNPTDGSSGVPIADIAKIKAAAGVKKVGVELSQEIVLLGSNGKAVQTGGAPSVGSAYYPASERVDPPATVHLGSSAPGGRADRSELPGGEVGEAVASGIPPASCGSPARRCR